jgi:hypothetical protein
MIIVVVVAVVLLKIFQQAVATQEQVAAALAAAVGEIIFMIVVDLVLETTAVEQVEDQIIGFVERMVVLELLCLDFLLDTQQVYLD